MDKKNNIDALKSYNEEIVNSIIEAYNESIYNKLVDGEEVVIPKVGKLQARYRKVRNNYGREFTIRVRLFPEKEFTNVLVREHKKDPERYVK